MELTSLRKIALHFANQI